MWKNKVDQCLKDCYYCLTTKKPHRSFYFYDSVDDVEVIQAKL